MRLPARLAAFGALGAVLLVAFPIGTTWVHYSSSANFRDWARARPVGEDVWRASVPAGRVVGYGTPWRSNKGPAGERRGQWRPRVTITHGEEVLLELELDVSFESREVDDWLERGVPSEAFEALAVEVKRSLLDPDFHAVAVITATGFSSYPESVPKHGRPQGPEVRLDVFALAGPGEVEIIVQDIDPEAAGRAAKLLGNGEFADSGTWAVGVLSDVLFADDPPEEGIGYQVRAWFPVLWTRTKGGGTTVGLQNMNFGATTRLYSANLRCEQTLRPPFDPPDHFGMTKSAEVKREYTWNGQVW